MTYCRSRRSLRDEYIRIRSKYCPSRRSVAPRRSKHGGRPFAGERRRQRLGRQACPCALPLSLRLGLGGCAVGLFRPHRAPFYGTSSRSSSSITAIASVARLHVAYAKRLVVVHLRGRIVRRSSTRAPPVTRSPSAPGGMTLKDFARLRADASVMVARPCGRTLPHCLARIWLFTDVDARKGGKADDAFRARRCLRPGRSPQTTPQALWPGRRIMRPGCWSVVVASPGRPSRRPAKTNGGVVVRRIVRNHERQVEAASGPPRPQIV